MQHEDFSLDRNHSVENNIDATGKKWHIIPVRGLALFEISAMDDRVAIPKSLRGRWTKASWLQEKVTEYVTQSWDYAEEKAKKVERKVQAKKEQKKKVA